MTLLYLYYNNPNAIMFFESINMQDYPVDILFIDDGSQPPLKLDWPNAKVLRIEEDIPWNMPAANNLGFQHLYNKNPFEIVLRMDIDHYPTLETLKKIQRIQPPHKTLIKFQRENIDSHPNIYLANVMDILNAGGYNTAFCGNYGYDDKELMLRLSFYGYGFIQSKLKINVNNSLGTKNLSRDITVNHKLYQNIKSTFKNLKTHD